MRKFDGKLTADFSREQDCSREYGLIEIVGNDQILIDKTVEDRKGMAMDQLSGSSLGRTEEIRRIARVLEIIQQIISAPRQWTRQKLAEHHEVSERMIQKDLEIMRYRLGLKLNHDRSGYYFEHLPSLPTLNYSFAEGLALLMAARAAQQLAGINSAELAAAIARLETLFPPELVPLLREATDKLPKGAKQEHRHAMLLLIHRALTERRKVQMDYLSTSQEEGKKKQAKVRKIEPYAVFPYGKSWLMVAFDHLKQEPRTFKLDRIQRAELLDEHYDPPQDFQLEEYFGDNWGIIRDPTVEVVEVSLLFDSMAGRWVSEEVWHKSQVNEMLEDGQVRVRFKVGVTDEMILWLLRYGEHVYIEEPDWLRAKVRAAHYRAAQRLENGDLLVKK